jgi:hypothetical protein
LLLQASYQEEDWSKSFWGDNYPRLSQIKTKYDPNMTFWVTPGVHADHVQVIEGRVCRSKVNSQIPSHTPPASDKVMIADLGKERDFLFGRTELIGATYPAPGTQIGLQAA